MKARRKSVSKGNRLGIQLPLSVFVKQGYLQEANRRFFHPLGLALTVAAPLPGEFTELWIQDFRGDPEGLVFDELSDLDSRRKARQIDREWYRRAVLRKLALNYVVQPIGRNAPRNRSLHDRVRKSTKKCVGNQLVQGKGINATKNKRRSRRAR
jgi:hypothetical protein